MKVLIVEDESHVAAELSDCLSGCEPQIDSVIVGSRSSAFEALQDDSFDFIVCDLRLPPNDGGVDTDEAHGLAVHSEAKTLCPGTPRLFFTGFTTSSAVSEQLSSGGTFDIWGSGEQYAMTRLLTKDRLMECVDRIAAFNSELATLDTIRLEQSGIKRSLDHTEQRALRILARRLHGTSIEATLLGGQSGARALSTSVKDEEGRTLGSYFTKIGARTKMKEERERYQQFVSPLLKLGHYPALEYNIEAGLGKREALFYQLADGYTRSLFDVLVLCESAAIVVVEALRETFSPWAAVTERKSIRIRDLRAQKMNDSAFLPYRGALSDVENFEAIELELTTSCQHGDLHGFNVLCSESGKAVVIDFGNVGPAPSCVDPILLELSLLFHSDSPFRNYSWPTTEQAESWFNLQEYLVGCPVPKFITKCREWAIAASGSRELPPVLYTEAVRQLKYEDTNHERALGIARAAMER